MLEKFLEAVYQVDHEKIKNFLKITPDFVNALVTNNALQWRIIHLVSALGHSSTLDLLLRYEVNVSVKDSYGWNAVHQAIIHDQPQCLQLLIQSGASVDSLTEQHESPALLAVTSNNSKILRYLINKGADLQVQSRNGLYPIHEAVINGHLECLKIILAQSNNLYGYKNSLFLASLQANQVGSAHILLSNAQQDEINLSNLESICGAHTRLYLNIFNVCRNIQKDKKILFDSTLLMQCIKSSNVELVISSISLLNSISEVFFQKSPQEKIKERLRHLTTQYNINELLTTCLMLCSCAAIRWILDYFLEINVIEINFHPLASQESIFKLAIAKDQVSFLEVLGNYYGHHYLTRNIDDYDETPVHTAVRYGAIAALEYLIQQRNFSVEIKNRRGESPLHYAIRYGRDDMLYLLIHKYHANVNSVDENHNTPLHLAAQNGNIHGIHMLLNTGFCDVTIVNSMGKMPLRLAKAKNNQPISSVLSNFSQEQSSISSGYNTLVFQGGGVKGIAFYGAVKKLIDEGVIDLDNIHCVGGTSAGAITALVLAIGYDVEETGSLLRELDFFALLEEECRDEFFSLYKTLQKRHGLRELLGEQFHSLYLNLKGGTTDTFGAIKPYIADAITEKLSPTGFLHKLTELFGGHANEYQKIMQDIENLKAKLDPFINRITKYRGLFDGEVLRKKFVDWIKRKNLDSNLTFYDLHVISRSDTRFKDLYVAAYDANEKRTIVFSYETTPNVVIADAIRCSMSIQVFFVPHKKYICKDGLRIEVEKSHDYYDGGSLDNYILGYFDKKKYVFPSNSQAWLKQYGEDVITNPKAMGFRLVSPDKYAYYEKSEPLPLQTIESNMEFLSSLLSSLSTFTNQENQHVSHSDQIKRTVHINTHDIDTVEFDITEDRKKLLIASGAEGSEFFIKRQVNKESTHIPPFLKYYFHFDPLCSESSGFLIPRDSDIRFSKILKMAQSVSAQSLQRALQIISISSLVQDSTGNTLFHWAIQLGDIALLEKLYLIEKTLNIKNLKGQMALDCIVHCHDLKKRESILNFFVQKNIWHSTILLESSKVLPTGTDKRNYMLSYAYKANVCAWDKHALFSDERCEQELIMLQQLAKQREANWTLYSKDVVMNYVYLLIARDHIDLLLKLKLPIDQADSNGLTALHIFVIQNNKICVEKCLSKPILAYYNVIDKKGETPLDKVLDIQSFSTEDTVLQKQLMIFKLLELGVFRCLPKNKKIILNILASVINFKSEYNTLIQKFSNYNQSANDKQERNIFKRNRDNYLINREYNEAQKSNLETNNSEPTMYKYF